MGIVKYQAETTLPTERYETPSKQSSVLLNILTRQYIEQ
jgi:hypothetical protein